MIKRFLSIGFFILILLTLFKKSTFATQAQLACSPSTSTVSVGQTIVTDIILNANEYDVTGATVVMTYTPAIIQTSTSDLTSVTDTTGWSEPTTSNVDTSVGKITLDYGSSQTAFTEETTIGKVTFTAKAAGTSQVSFVYFKEYDDETEGVAKVYGERTPGETTNILTDVVNCQYTVTGAASTPIPTSLPGSTVAPTILPRTGGGDFSSIIFVGGAVLLGIGVFLTKFAYL